MGKYVESNLGREEVVVKTADRNSLALLGIWIKGILFFWLLLIPTIKAIIATIQFLNIELAITNKRIVGKVGVLNTKTLDAPLNKIQNVGTSQTFFGKIFNYGIINIDTAAGKFTFDYVKNADAFKGQILEQIDIFEEERIQQQADKMAKAMAGAIAEKE